MFDPRITQLTDRARQLIQQEAWPQVLEVFDQVVELAPREAGGHYNRASVLHHLGRLEEAEAALARALALRPVYPMAQQLLAKVTRQLGPRRQLEAPGGPVESRGVQSGLTMPMAPDTVAPQLPPVAEPTPAGPPPAEAPRSLIPEPGEEAVEPIGLPPASQEWVLDSEPEEIGTPSPASGQRALAPKSEETELVPTARPAPTPWQQAREQFAAAVVGKGSGEVYPWEIPPDRLELAEAYDASGQFRAAACRARELLSGLLKPEATEEAVEAEFRVYPDMVGVLPRPEKPGCLDKLQDLPGPLGPAFSALATAFLAVLALPFMGLGCLAALPGVLLGVLLAIFGAILAPLAMLLVKLLMAVAQLAERFPWIMWLAEFLGGRSRRIAERIRRDPLSPWAIKRLYRMTALIPRFWRRGEVVQIVRLDARRRLRLLGLILLVQDRPLPANPGCTGAVLGLIVERLFFPQRRVYMLRLEGGPEQADEFAALAAEVLGVPVSRGHLALPFGTLKIG